jgi:hypothetical protein
VVLPPDVSGQRERDVRFVEVELREDDLREGDLREVVFREFPVPLPCGERLLPVEPFATWRTRDIRSSGSSEARLFAPSTTSLAWRET